MDASRVHSPDELDLLNQTIEKKITLKEFFNMDEASLSRVIQESANPREALEKFRNTLLKYHDIVITKQKDKFWESKEILSREEIMNFAKLMRTKRDAIKKMELTLNNISKEIN